MTLGTAAVRHTDAAQTDKFNNKHTKHKQTKVRTERKKSSLLSFEYFQKKN